MASLVAGLTLVVAPVVARRSMLGAALGVFAGTSGLFGWFLYAVPELSDPIFLYESALLPVASGVVVVALWRRRRIVASGNV